MDNEQKFFLNEIKDILYTIKEISNDLSRQAEINKNNQERNESIKGNIDDINKKLKIIDSEIIKISGIKKIFIIVGSVISITIGFSTYYSEYLLDKPSPTEQQKSINLLWNKYNSIIDSQLISNKVKQND